MKDKLDYGQSKNGNFKVVDTIGVPHPFCITTRHVTYAADRHSGILGKDAIKHSGAPCGMKGCQLSIDEHEEALLISCLAPLKVKDEKGEEVANPELHEYLLQYKDQATDEGYAGFAFVDRNGSKTHKTD